MLSALERLYNQVNKNPHHAAAQIASYSSQLTLPTLTVACIMLEIRHYAEPALSLQLILPYRPAQTVAGFALYPLIYQPIAQPLPEATVMALVQALYQQASQFQSPMHSGNFWENYYVGKLGSDHLSPFEYQQRAQLIEHFDIGLLPIVEDIENTKTSPVSQNTPIITNHDNNDTSDIKFESTPIPTTFAMDNQINPAIVQPIPLPQPIHPSSAPLQNPASAKLTASLQEQLRQDQLRLKTSLSDSDTGKERKLIIAGLVIGVIIAVVMLTIWLKK